MLKENQAEFEILGITKFWDKGYTGKGINIGNVEKAYIESPHFHGKVFAPTGFQLKEPINEHGNHTAFMIHEVAYDSDIYCLDMGFNMVNSKYSGTLIDKTIPLIKEKNISVVNSSSWKLLTERRIGEITKDLRDNLVMCASAGNDGVDGLQGYATTDIWLAIGAVGYKDKDKGIYLRNYSSCGAELDYTSFSGLFVKDFRPDYPSRVYQIEGTSFSSPTFAGMCALVQQFFLEKVGQTLNQYQMENFIKDHLVDLGDLGWDDRYGHGLFILPNPDDIRVDKYLKITPSITIPITLTAPPILEIPKEDVIIIPIETTTQQINKSKIKVIVDGGHGGTDQGCSKFGYIEKDLTLIIGKRVNDLLSSYDSSMTRNIDKTIEPSNRTTLIKDKYDYCISIHLNAGGGDGIEAIHSVKSTQGKQLAEFIVGELHKNTGLPLRNKSVFCRTLADGKDYYYMHRETGNTVTVIVECLFLDNAENIKKMNIESIAQSIANGFNEFIKTQQPVEIAPTPKPTIPIVDEVQLLTYSRLLKNGLTGEDVKQLQSALVKLGYNPNGIDGIFGNGCDVAIKLFQKNNGLVVDGLVGQVTINKINELLKGNTTQPIISTSGYRKIRKFNSDVHIYEVGKDGIVDVELGKRNTLETVSVIMKNKLAEGKKVKAGINCGFFDWNSNKDHLGMYIDEGKYYFPPHNAQIDFIYYKDGTTKIQNLHGYDAKLLSELQAKTNWAIGTSYSLIQYGKINLENVDKYDHARVRNPRTLLGQKKDGTFLLVVVDGRSAISSGVTAQQSAELMYELGCYNGISCDGGGSSSMVVVENGKPIVKNKPSDGNERAVGSVILAM